MSPYNESKQSSICEKPMGRLALVHVTLLQTTTLDPKNQVFLLCLNCDCYTHCGGSFPTVEECLAASAIEQR